MVLVWLGDTSWICGLSRNLKQVVFVLILCLSFSRIHGFHHSSRASRNAASSFFTGLAVERTPPPDFTIINDNDEDSSDGFDQSAGANPTNWDGNMSPRAADIDKAAERDSYGNEESGSTSTIGRRPLKPRLGQGTPWLERNAAFVDGRGDDRGENASSDRRTDRPRQPQRLGQQGRRGMRPNSSDSGERRGMRAPYSDSGERTTFRQDFRGTRVFVQGLPADATWKDLKDHFRLAGEVVFASVSVNPETGESKGHGVVQYETTEMAARAIAVMRNHPMDGYQLYVRPDFQEGKDKALLNSRLPKGQRGPTPPTKWTCANDDNVSNLSEDELKTIRSLIKARDFARRQRQYDEADNIREELKSNYNVHVDDRLLMWWTGQENPPKAIQDIKGEGRWGGDAARPWRHIPTTPENDACVDPDLVNRLLAQRDIARRAKDFATADSLLEEARNSPDGDLSLRIHDESRTWRIWTDEPPVFLTRPDQTRQSPDQTEQSRDQTEQSPAEQCVALVEALAPDKVDEVKMLLEKFPGREYSILKKLKERYNV